MHPIVIYASSTGNTEKVALAIAEALQCPVTQLRQFDDYGTPFTPERWIKFDLFLLGSGIFAGHFSSKIKEFMESLAPKLDRKTFGFFCTWAGRGTSAADAVQELKKIAEKSGHRLIPKSFACYGRTMWVFHAHSPTIEDLAKAKEWAKYAIDIVLNTTPPRDS